MTLLKIGKKKIGIDSPAFIIAEAGINHNGELKIAKKLIDSAKLCNVDAVKFQTFTADDLASSKSNYYKLFKKVELSESDFGEISDYAKQNNIIFLSTPFSNNAVDILSKMKIPAFKISSGDLTDLPLRNSSLILSKIITLASTDIPTVKINPAIPGRVNVASSNARTPNNKIKVHKTEKLAIKPDRL